MLNQAALLFNSFGSHTLFFHPQTVLSAAHVRMEGRVPVSQEATSAYVT